MTDAATALPRLRHDAASLIHKGLGELRTCEAIDGAFDASELKRVGRAAPAVLVATTGARQMRPTDPGFAQDGYRVSMAAFLIAKPAPRLAAADAVLAMAQHLMAMLPEHRVGRDDCGPAERVEYRPVATSETRGEGVVLGVVAWEQPIVLSAAAQPRRVPIDLYYSQAPEIGADHVDDYTRAGGDA